MFKDRNIHQVAEIKKQSDTACSSAVSCHFDSLQIHSNFFALMCANVLNSFPKPYNMSINVIEHPILNEGKYHE